MDEWFLNALRALELQAFVKYVTVTDKNGYSVAACGETRKGLGPHIRELQSCVESLLPDASDIKIVVEGSEKSVIIGERDGFLVAVQVQKEMF
jgi:hypothetical protein